MEVSESETDPPPYSEILGSTVLIAENTPDIDMKIRESEFKTNGEIIKVKNRIDKLERDVKLCCPDYDKVATKLQSRLRGNKERWEFQEGHPDLYKKLTEDWVYFPFADAFPEGIPTGFKQGGPRYTTIGPSDSMETMKSDALTDRQIKGGYDGFATDGYHMWFRGKSKEELVDNIVSAGSPGHTKCDLYIAPGIDIHLLVAKHREGHDIEFCSKRDKRIFSVIRDSLPDRVIQEDVGGSSGVRRAGIRKKSRRKKSRRKKSRRKKSRRKKR